MRISFILLIVIFCTASIGMAQDSTVTEKKTVVSTVREKINIGVSKKNESQDSLTNGLPDDLIRNIADSLNRARWNPAGADHKYDSLQQILSKQNKGSTTADTVTKMVNKPIDKTESIEDSLHKKTDNFIQRKIDNVKQRVNKPIENVNSKISEAGKPIEQKASDINQNIGDKTEKVETNVDQAFNKATDGNVKSPLNLGENGVDVPGQKGGIGAVDLSDPNLPGMTDLPGGTLPDKSLKIPDADLNVDQLKTKMNVDVPKMDDVKKTSGQLGEVDSKLNEVEKYEQDIKGLKQMDSASVDNVAKQIEDKVSGLDEVKGVSEQKQLLNKQQLEYNAMMQLYQDKKLLKDEIARKSRNVVNGKIDKLTPAFKEAQEKIAKAKKLNPNAEKFKDGKIKRENKMASKPLYERLVPGITVQVYNKDVFTIDWGFQLGYKFSNRLIGGAGGVYRMGVSEKYASWVKGPGIYGYRAYADFNMMKGFYVHGEFESLHVNSIVNPHTQIETRSQVANSGYFGIGKRFDISKKIRGSAIILYRAEFKGDVPSMSRINLRIGFDLNTKKRTKLKSP